MQGMLTIRREDVPEYLRGGCWFEALCPDDEGAFEVPAECFKANQNIQTIDDLLFLLKSLQYWQVEHVPAEAHYFIYTNNQFDIGEEFPIVRSSLQNLKAVREASPKNRIATALRTRQSPTMIRWLHEHTACELCAKACAAAAGADDVESLAYLHEFGCPWDPTTIKEAATSGSINCMKYAKAHGCPALPTSENAISHAAKKGNIEMIRYLRNSGERWGYYTMSEAALIGDLACMKYLRKAGCRWDEKTCTNAAMSRNVECLKFAHENGCRWSDHRATSAAASNGDLTCLQYAHEHGCAWCTDVMCSAARQNRLDILMYAYENGCPWDQKTTSVALIRGNWQCLWYALRHGASYFVLVGALFPLLGWAVCTTYMIFALYTWLSGHSPARYPALMSVVLSLGSGSNAVRSIVPGFESELLFFVSPAFLRRLGYVGHVLLLLAIVVMVLAQYDRYYHEDGMQGQTASQ